MPACVTDTSHSPPPFHHHVVPLVPPATLCPSTNSPAGVVSAPFSPFLSRSLSLSLFSLRALRRSFCGVAARTENDMFALSIPHLIPIAVIVSVRENRRDYPRDCAEGSVLIHSHMIDTGEESVIEETGHDREHGVEHTKYF